MRWLLEGAFLYFNSTYDVVAINALCAEDLHTSSTAAEALNLHTSSTAPADQKDLATSALYFGPQCRVPAKSVEVLHRRGRWWGLAQNEELKGNQYRKFAWVLPCEFLGSHVFPNAGGFAFQLPDGSAHFYAVVMQNASVEASALRDSTLGMEMQPSVFEPSSHIQQLWKYQNRLQQDEDQGEKFKSEPAVETTTFGDSHLAAVGESPKILKTSDRVSGGERGSEREGDGLRGHELLARAHRGRESIVLTCGDEYSIVLTCGDWAGMESLLCHGRGNPKPGSPFGDDTYNDMDFLEAFVSNVKDNDAAGDRCFLDLTQEERDTDAAYGGKCVLEEVRTAVNKEWDNLDGGGDPDDVAAEDEKYHYFKWAEYVVQKPVSEGKDFEEPWMTDVSGNPFLYTVDKNRPERSLRDFHGHLNCQV